MLCPSVVRADSPPPEIPPDLVQLEPLQGWQLLIDRMMEDDNTTSEMLERAETAQQVLHALERQGVTDPKAITTWMAAALSAEPKLRRAALLGADQGKLGDTAATASVRQALDKVAGLQAPEEPSVAEDEPEPGEVLASDPLVQAVLEPLDLAARSARIQELMDAPSTSSDDQRRLRMAQRICEGLEDQQVDDPALAAAWLAAAMSTDVSLQRAAILASSQRRLWKPEAVPRALADFTIGDAASTTSEPASEVEETANQDVEEPELPRVHPIRDLGGIPSAAQPAVVQRELDSGMRVVVVGDPLLQLSAVVHTVDAGSAAELEGQAGLAHLVEHLMFTGTAAFPEDAWWGELSALGGDTNAFTTWDRTRYLTRVVPEGLDLVLRMEADRLLEFEPSAAALERERAVITDELRLIDGLEPAARRSLRARSTLMKGHAYGRSIGGDLESVAGLDMETVLAFHQDHYSGVNLQLVVVGPHDPQAVTDRIQALYEGLPAGEPSAPAPRFELPAKRRMQLPGGPGYGRLTGVVWPLAPGFPCASDTAAAQPCSDDFWASEIALGLLAQDGVSQVRDSLSRQSMMSVPVWTDMWRGDAGGYVLVAAERRPMVGVAAWNTWWSIVAFVAGLNRITIIPPYRSNPTAKRVKAVLRSDNTDWITGPSIAEARDDLLFAQLERAWGADDRAVAITQMLELGLEPSFDVAEAIGSQSASGVRQAYLDIVEQKGAKIHVW